MAEKDKFADEKLSDEELDGVAGGSWYVKQKDAERAGITLKKDDGSPGKWDNLWNTGNYYWRGKEISGNEARAVIGYITRFNRQPKDIEEAKEYQSGYGNSSYR